MLGRNGTHLSAGDYGSLCHAFTSLYRVVGYARAEKHPVRVKQRIKHVLGKAPSRRGAGSSNYLHKSTAAKHCAPESAGGLLMSMFARLLLELYLYEVCMLERAAHRQRRRGIKTWRMLQVPTPRRLGNLLEAGVVISAPYRPLSPWTSVRCRQKYRRDGHLSPSRQTVSSSPASP